jgi:hypothetical protein
MHSLDIVLNNFSELVKYVQLVLVESGCYMGAVDGKC